jgi:hypothetical protein
MRAKRESWARRLRKAGFTLSGKNSGPLTGARIEEEELGPAAVMPRSPGGKVLSTKIRCSGGTGTIISPEVVSSPIVPFYSDYKKTVTAALSKVCHSERSEESALVRLGPELQILRFAQDDNDFHPRGWSAGPEFEIRKSWLNDQI